MWRYPWGKTDMPDASRVVLSPDAGHYAYICWPNVEPQLNLCAWKRQLGNATVSGLPIIDVTKQENLHRKSGPWLYQLYSPCCHKGTRTGLRLCSASGFSSYCSRIRGTGGLWRNGLVSQPIVNRDGKMSSPLQSGKLHVYAQLNGTDDGTDKKLRVNGERSCATSNLVLDGL